MHVDLAPFLALSILLIVIPGPDTAVVMKNALAGGKRGGVFAAFGVALGLTVWTFAAALGIAALLRASELAFDALKLVGAVYLIWIGVQLLRKPGGAAAAAAAAGARRQRAIRSLRQGLLSDLGNPKIAVFFTSFLPQFVGHGGSTFAALLLLGLLFAALTLAWLAAYGAAIGHGTRLLRRPRVQRALDRFTGVVFLGFGVRLAFEHR
ncbi:MAG TPA: LysE family translocator [Gaiellaceae bacterium]|nr:LysE family translocator [Gaiellaceae bacterium]